MMRPARVCVILSFVGIAISLYGHRLAAQEKRGPAAASTTTPINEELRKELLHRSKDDQDARQALIDAMNKQKGSSTEQGKPVDPALRTSVEDMDQANTARMKEIVDRHGWPGKSLVGKDGAMAAWLLVQHADRDPAFQKRSLALIREAFKKGDVTGQELAYLTDRVRLAQGEKQVYGTQFHTVDGKLVPQPIEDEANVDNRRKEAGLSTIAEYEKMLRQVYKTEPKK